MPACGMESRWSVSPATAPASLMPRAKEKASPGRGRKMAGAAAADAHRKASELSPAPRAICPRELIRRAAIEPGPPLPGRWRRNLTAPWRSSHACENSALVPMMSPRV